VHGDDTDERGAWPIHTKDVTTINYDALYELPGIPGSTTAERWTRKRRWLEDDSVYEEHGVIIRGAPGTPEARYKPMWIDRLCATHVIEQIDKKHVRGWTRLYAVPEPAKKRFRAIMHTVDINDACGSETLDSCTFPTKRTIADAVHDGEYMIALDFSAYYYQFALHESVGRRMCFRWNGRLFRLKKLAMGQRQAVDIANAATMRMLDFETKSRRVMSIIDNVVFIGSRDAVVDDAWTFIQRCKAVNATLNEIDVRGASRDDVATLVLQAGDWGGVHVDLVDKTVCLTEKIVKKTRLSWANRATWQWRHYAAHIGLLFWAWRIVDLPMASFFEVLRFNSEVGKAATQRYASVKRELGLPDDATPANPFWSEPAVVWQSVAPILERWTEIVLRNSPRAVKPPLDLEIILECDASKWGWSFCGLHLATDEPFAYKAPWSDEMRRRFGEKLGESTFAEPFGVLYSLERMREHFPDATRFGVTNDNNVAVISHQRAFNSRSWHINECMRHRELLMPENRFSISLRHVAGVNNIADSGSRGGPVCDMNGEIKRVLRSRWGITDEVKETSSSNG
jgi:hypothetical protein